MINHTNRHRFFAAACLGAGLMLGPVAFDARATVAQVGSDQTTPYTVSASDLLNGVAASSSVGNFAQEGSGGVPVLTDGSFGPLGGGNNTGAATGGNTGGTQVTYDLNLGASPMGYTITNIDTFVGWNDAGRNDQSYTVQYSTVGDASYKTIYTATYASGTGNPSATRVQATDSNGLMASNVDSVRFIFNGVENGYTGYRELDVFGAPDDVSVSSGSQATAYTVASGDLLETAVSSVSYPNQPGPGGLFARESAGGATVLNDGSFGNLVAANPGPVDNSGAATIGVGEDIIYNFDLAASPSGYRITEINTYAGWGDQGRDDQGYTVLYSLVGDPSTFIPLLTADVQTAGAPNTVPGATMIQSLVDITGVAALYFDFDEVENGYTGYREIDVIGFAVPTPAALPAGLGLLGLATLRRRRR